jgi:hypothetical protein
MLKHVPKPAFTMKFWVDRFAAAGVAIALASSLSTDFGFRERISAGFQNFSRLGKFWYSMQFWVLSAEW